MSKDKRDDYPTIRITNLSPDVKDNDVRDLVSRFGSTARVVNNTPLHKPLFTSNTIVCCQRLCYRAMQRFCFC